MQFRQNNYDKLLAMFNDTMAERNTQVSACGTPKFLEDQDGDCSTIKHGLTPL